MWKIGDNVIYGTSGVCRVEGKQKRLFDDAEKEYYLLTPLGARQSSVIYVPTDNPALLANIHALLSSEELLALLPRVTPFSREEWGEDSRGHNKVCKSVLASGDRLSLLRLVRTVFGNEGRRPTNGEESAALRAAAMLYEEFSLALEITPEEVVPLILGKLAPKTKK